MNETQPSGLEANVEYVKRRFYANRKAIFWCAFGLATFWLLLRVKEVTSLLVLSYVLALLLDPVVARMERKGMSRGLAIGALFALILIIILAFVALAVPAIITEYGNLVELLPDYIRVLAAKLHAALSAYPNIQKHLNMIQERNCMFPI